MLSGIYVVLTISSIIIGNTIATNEKKSFSLHDNIIRYNDV